MNTQCGPYRIAAGIGAGGMGEVFRARDTPVASMNAVLSEEAPELSASNRSGNLDIWSLHRKTLATDHG